MYTLVSNMPAEWRRPPFGEEIDLRLLGDAVYSDGDPDAEFRVPVLTSPFYHQILYTPFMHEWANAAMAHKEMRIRESIQKGKVLDLVWYYERPYRADYIHTLWEWWESGEFQDPPGFLSSWDDLIKPMHDALCAVMENDPTKFWQQCTSVWTDNENIWQEVDKWYDLWHDLSTGTWWMDDDNLKRFQELPDKIEVWRGECNDGGWSYSLDQGTGEFFARRPFNESTGEVVMMEIPKDAVYCFIGDRGEEEVILLEEDLSEFEIERYSVRNS